MSGTAFISGLRSTCTHDFSDGTELRDELVQAEITITYKMIEIAYYNEKLPNSLEHEKTIDNWDATPALAQRRHHDCYLRN